jgi:hypothetical protein
MTDEKAAAPWTIKSVKVETRKLAVDSAMKQGITMAEWLDRAVRNQANLDKGNQVIPPGQTGQTLARPDPVQLPTPTGKLPMDLAGLADALRAVAALTEAAAMPVPKALAREAAGLLRQQIREARGLPSKAK